MRSFDHVQLYVTPGGRAAGASVQPDESIRELPPSTATSVDSRAALLSSFWDTMSTDHAPEVEDERNGNPSAAHTGQCVSGPGQDAPDGNGQTQDDQHVKHVVTADKARMTLNPDHGFHVRDHDRDGGQSSRFSPPHAEEQIPPAKRQSLHLRVASLSPTLSSSPGLRMMADGQLSDSVEVVAPCSFSPMNDGVHSMGLDTRGSMNISGTATQGDNAQVQDGIERLQAADKRQNSTARDAAVEKGGHQTSFAIETSPHRQVQGPAPINSLLPDSRIEVSDAGWDRKACLAVSAPTSEQDPWNA
eukprot:jgi/Ulvmu1/6980/UM033_0038.1